MTLLLAVELKNGYKSAVILSVIQYGVKQWVSKVTSPSLLRRTMTRY